MKKMILILLVGVLVLSNLNGCMFLVADALLSEEETTTNESNNATTIETSVNNTEENNTEETKQENKNNIVMIGDCFQTDDLKFTVTDISLNYTDYEDEYGWYKPEEGIKYIMVSFKFENISDEDKYVSIYDFDCYADGSLCEQNFFVDSGDFINTNLSPNRNVSFMICFDVPTECSEIELEYEVNMWTDERIILKLQ